MLSLKLTCHVPENRTVTVRLPDEIQPGEHELVLVIDQSIPEPKDKRRRPGSAKGKLIIMAEDDKHLEEFKEYLP